VVHARTGTVRKHITGARLYRQLEPSRHPSAGIDFERERFADV
jgi:hypothetical protein